jgi:cytochrome c biogenesis protein CcmG, thiol:disulfide interchange protein DsbE
VEADPAPPPTPAESAPSESAPSRPTPAEPALAPRPPRRVWTLAGTLRPRAGRPLIVAVLVVVAVILPAGVALLDRNQPATQPPPSSVSTAAHPYPPGTPAPPLRLQGLDGRQIDLAALRGRPVVVNFWATWCEPCVREFPLLRQAAATHRPDRLAVVGVLTNDRPAAARAFVRDHHATWPVGIDPDATTAGRWGAVGLPHTYFIRPDGTLASHQLGELTQPALNRQLATILP